MLRHQLLQPVVVLGARIAVLGTHHGSLAGEEVLQQRQLGLQAAGQDEQAHHLDQADVLLLDVVQRRMGMEDAQRMLLAGAVVAQHQVQPVHAVHLAQDGRDGVVGRAVRLGIHVAFGIGIAAPGIEDALRLVNQRSLIRAGQLHRRHGPVQHAGRDLRVGRGQLRPHAAVIHGEAVAAALEVVMVQDGAAHDGQIGIAAQHVVGHLPDEAEQPLEGAPVDLHGDMLAVEDDAMLRIIGVRGILHVPVLTGQLEGHHAVILPCGEVAAAGIAGILDAQHALGVAHGGRVLQLGDLLGILLRLGQVDGDFQLTRGAVGKVAHVLGDGVHLDVVAHAAHVVEILGGLLRLARVNQAQEGVADFLGGRGHQTHDPGGEQIPRIAHILDEALLHRQVAQGAQKLRGRRRNIGGGRDVAVRRVHPHHIQQEVAVVRTIHCLEQTMLLGEIQQRFQRMRDLFRPVHARCLDSSRGCRVNMWNNLPLL